MRHCLLALVAAVAVVACVAAEPPKDEAAKKDMELLRGTWVLVGREAQGRRMSDREFKEMQDKHQISFVFKGSEGVWRWAVVSYQSPDGKTRWSGVLYPSPFMCRLEPTKQPKEMDLEFRKNPTNPKEYTLKAIYSIEGDTLKICTGDRADLRPTRFATESGSNGALLVLQRQKH
jgi:uncharacterized protein (TIGR03067 family)